MEEDRRADISAVLSNETRRRIRDLLREGEKSLTEISEELGMYSSGVIKHLKKMQATDPPIVAKRVETVKGEKGTPVTYTLYSLTDEYTNLFKPVYYEVKVEKYTMLPIYVLAVVWFMLILLSVFFTGLVKGFYELFGVGRILVANIVGLILILFIIVAVKLYSDGIIQKLKELIRF